MEYVYAAMLLHKAGKKIDEAHLKKVLEAAGVKADTSRIKALVAALENVNIDEAVASPVTQVVAPAPEVKEEKKEEKKPEPEQKSEEEAAAGLGALFG